VPKFLAQTETRKLMQSIDWHLDNIRDDAELSKRIEGLAANPRFRALTFAWAPRLYRRNRAMFRPFVMQHFADVATLIDGQRFEQEPIEWSGEVAAALEPWFDEVDRANDAALFRRLFAWRHRGKHFWRVDAAAWQAALIARFGAPSASQRALALDKLDLWSELGEDAALRLYAIDAELARAFILKHLPSRGWREDEQRVWRELMNAAERRGDRAFAFKLYRRQVPVKQWRTEVMALAAGTPIAADLLELLRERHPEGSWDDLGPTFVALLEARGADVLPYVQHHLSDARSGGWFRGDSAAALASLARRRGWIDFWIAVLVKIARGGPYNAGLTETIEDRGLPELERLRRLALFSGVSREWNFAGWGMAAVQQLEPKAALLLYERYPDLLRTQFKAHVTPAWHATYGELFERAWAQGDEDLADHLASRYLTRGMWGGQRKSELAEAERAADLLVELKLDPAHFVRRAASILTRVPAYAIRDYANLIRNNRLARLLFERSMADFLADESGMALRDLVEGSEIHVQRLAYRVLALPDARARRFARDQLDILIGTLLRPLHRETRTHALAALANAAHDADAAKIVLARARDAFALPDKRYPKEALLGLVARVLAMHPALAQRGERPVIHRRAACSRRAAPRANP
jgi:hypothetical protein